MTFTLLTGAPGWLGTRLAYVLVNGLPEIAELRKPKNNRQIRCLVLPGQDISRLQRLEDRVDIVNGDLRDIQAVKAFCKQSDGATLFHCAGLVHPKLSVSDLFDINVQGTRNLLQAAEEAGIRRAVVISSNSPIGNNPSRDHLFDENSQYNPYMSYGRSKMQMEKLVHEYQARGKLETVIIRPPWFYGPEQPERQTTFFSMIKNGSAPIVGNGENLRSMAYIDNLCQGILLSENSPVANGQTYWIADERPYSMNEIIDTVERLMEDEFGFEVAHKRLRLPFITSEISGLIDALIQKTGFYQQKIHVLSEMNKTIACSIEKARRELGYQPTIALEEGMRRSLIWCQEQGIAI